MTKKENDKIDLIYDFVKEVDRKVDHIVIEQTKQSGYIEQNTKDLYDHIEGVKQTRSLLLAHEKRNETQFNELKYPKKVTMTVIKLITIVGTISASIYGIYRVANIFL